MATTSKGKVVMNGSLAFNSFGDVVLHFDEAIDGLVNGQESVRDTITLPKGIFGAYLRENIEGYSAKCQDLSKKDKGLALVQRFFSVALEHAEVTVSAHHHTANDSYGDGVYSKDGYHYTIDGIENIDQRVIEACKPFSVEQLDNELFG